MSLSPNIDFRPFARSLGTVVTYASGDTIFRENDVAKVMYIVLDGAVTNSRHEKVIETVRAGEAFGVLSLIDGQPIPITAVASERCELALIDEKKFRFMVEEVPNFVWYVMGELAHRLRTTNAAL